MGRTMVLGLLEAGHQVLIVDRLPEGIAETLALAADAGHGGRAFGMTADLTQAGIAPKVIAAAEAAMGGIDILVNNAGLGPNLIAPDYLQNPPHFADLGETTVRAFFEVNGIAPFLLAIEAARRMTAQGWGRIVNVSTSHDSMMRRGFAPYGGTKASIEAHTAIMAQDLEGSGVTANVLIPGGAVDTAMIPNEAGFDRSALIAPDVMIPPLLWMLGPDAPNGRRVLAVQWSPDAPMNAPAGWPSDSKAIIPKGRT